MNTAKILLTSEGLEELKKEYENLSKKKRPVAVERLAQARSQGDLSENSEYTAARQDLTFIDGRIAELELVLHEAKVVNSHSRQHVSIGSRVTIHLNNKKHEYMIVGEWEADPVAKKISHTSPLGKALIGKKAGESVDVDAPAGRLTYKILEIQ